MRESRLYRALAFVLRAICLLAILFALSLGLAVLLYDGPQIRFGVGGLSLFGAAAPGSVTLDALSLAQRALGALLVQLLCAPVVFILMQAAGLFRLSPPAACFRAIARGR